MTYGVPYQGSKNRIAKDIIDLLPTGKRFVDLFAGGCAMTHAAILSQKYEKFLCNDLYPHGVNLFKNALNGEYSKPEYLRWVSRDEFFAKKDTDDFVKMCYSFASNGMDYMYSQKLEPLKKGFHYAVVFDDWSFLEQYAKEHNWRDGLIEELKKSVEGVQTTDERRLKLQRVAHNNEEIGITSSVVESLLQKHRIENLELINERRLSITRVVHKNEEIGISKDLVQNLERTNRLQNLEREQSLDIDFTSLDYRDYKHEDGDVVYCDPPYDSVRGYSGRKFDNKAFWEWVRTRDYPVYVSEYNAPDDFVSIWQKGIAKTRAGGKSARNKAIEHLFIHNRWRKTNDTTES